MIALYIAALGLTLFPIAVDAAANSCAAQVGLTNYGISTFGGPNGCLPSGYGPAMDLGQTNQADLITRCRAQCKAYGDSCQAFVGILNKAADSDRATGQCYFYRDPPVAPAFCADYPSTILAEVKDNTPECFATAGDIASAFCSSYLSIGTATVYTSTVTPRVTQTVTSTTEKITTRTLSRTAKETEYTTTTTTSTQVRAVRGASTSTTLATIYSTITSGISVIGKRTIEARAPSAPAPSCLNTNKVPASVISTGCSCFSIASVTVSAVLTLPTVTSFATATATSKVISVETTFFTTSYTTKIKTTKENTVSTSTSYSVTTTTSTTLATTTVPVCSRQNLLSNGDFENGQKLPWYFASAHYLNQAAIVEDAPESGRYAFKATNGAGANAAFGIETVPVTPGKTYRLTWREKQSAPFNAVRIDCSPNGAGGSGMSGPVQGPFPANNGYSTYCFDCPVGSNNKVVLYISRYVYGGSTWYLDHTSFTELC